MEPMKRSSNGVSRKEGVPTVKIQIWNQFMEKRGWRDDSSAELKEMKAKRGFADREDILTFFDFHDADEGRS